MHIFALLRSSLLFSSRIPLAMLGSTVHYQSHSDIQLQREGKVSDAFVNRVFNQHFAAGQLFSGELKPSDVVERTWFR
jgi:hypothetical protein